MAKIPHWLTPCGGAAMAATIYGWMSTLDHRGLFYDPSLDPCHRAERSRIYLFWHEYILLPLYSRGHCNLTMLLSKHRDADILARVARHMGFQCVRGSTYGGAATALRELARAGKQMHLTITPDGPRGPRRRLAQGPVYLASRTQLPIVPVGFGYDRPWRARSWDRFAVPRPMSRVRTIMGPEVTIPSGLDRSQLEVHRQGVERLMNQLTLEAETWAASGERRRDSVPGVRRRLARSAEDILRTTANYAPGRPGCLLTPTDPPSAANRAA